VYFARHANVETVLSKRNYVRVEEKSCPVVFTVPPTHKGPAYLGFHKPPAALQQLNVPDCPHKHQSKGSRSEMADAMAGVITAKLKKDIGERHVFLCQCR